MTNNIFLNNGVWWVVILFISSIAGGTQHSVSFRGRFAQVDFSNAQCADLFDDHEYLTTHYWVGPNNLQSVLALKGPTNTYFNQMVLVGSIGYQSDFFNERTFSQNGLTHRVTTDGIVQTGFILAEVSVVISNPAQSSLICSAHAQLFAH